MLRGLLALALVACAANPPPAATTQVTSAAIPTTARAPAGARVVVRLENELSTGASTAGQTFIARLVEPLRAADGRVLAPAGAAVVGHIGEIDFGVAGAHMRLVFDRIETSQGVFPIAARLVSAEHRDTPGELREQTGGDVLEVPARLVYPAGATLTLELVRPLG